MKEDILEYYQNGRIKHKIIFYLNGCKNWEQYYDHNGLFHREAQLPDYQSWYDNGYLRHRTFCIHGYYNNINNPADIWFYQNGKIDDKYYNICNNNLHNKLNWMNQIKKL